MTKLSRSKIELFLDCPRCFWLDMVQRIKRPPPAPYTINNAVDYLLKQEFDIHREKGTPHPVMTRHGVEALPFQHEKMGQWRHNFTGVQYEHKPTDFLVYGAVDDIWVNADGAVSVVDYKATGANQHHIYPSYKRQMEIYQWLLGKNGLTVSPIGYFVFAKVSKAGGFGMGTAALTFDLLIEPQEGDNSWIEEALVSARKTFDKEKPPAAGAECEYCRYRKVAAEF
mgnify:FL=1